MKNVFSVLVIFISLFAQSTFATTGKSYRVLYHQTIRHSQSQYIPVSKDVRTYKMVAQRTVSDHIVEGEGPFKTHNFKNKGVENTHVLGVDVPGYAKIRFEQGENDEVCTIVFSALNEESGESAEVRRTGQFVQGSWKDYVAGRFVRIRVENQPESVENALISALFQLQDSISYDQYLALAKYEISKPMVEKIQFEGREEFQGSSETGFQGSSPQITAKGGLDVTIH